MKKLLIVLIILSIIIRIPITSNEVGNDSFLVHGEANSISTYGKAIWVIHPLSFIGIYPLSVPSTVPFLLSGISQTVNLEMAQVILIYSILLGIIGIFTMYILALELKNDTFLP